MTNYDIVTNEMATAHQQPSNHTKHHSLGLNAELLKVSERNACEGTGRILSRLWPRRSVQIGSFARKYVDASTICVRLVLPAVSSLSLSHFCVDQQCLLATVPRTDIRMCLARFRSTKESNHSQIDPREEVRSSSFPDRGELSRHSSFTASRPPAAVPTTPRSKSKTVACTHSRIRR